MKPSGGQSLFFKNFKNSEATASDRDVRNLADLFEKAFREWHKEMGEKMGLTNNPDEWPPGPDEDEKFLTYAEQHRDGAGLSSGSRFRKTEGMVAGIGRRPRTANRQRSKEGRKHEEAVSCDLFALRLVGIGAALAVRQSETAPR